MSWTRVSTPLMLFSPHLLILPFFCCHRLRGSPWPVVTSHQIKALKGNSSSASPKPRRSQFHSYSFCSLGTRLFAESLTLASPRVPETRSQPPGAVGGLLLLPLDTRVRDCISQSVHVLGCACSDRCTSWELHVELGQGQTQRVGCFGSYLKG